MRIEGLGDVLAIQLVDAKLVKDVGDLYSLTLEQVTVLPRMAKKSATNLLTQIETSKSQEILQVSFMRGNSARRGENRWNTRPAFWLWKAIKCKHRELDDIPEIGLTVAQSVRDWFDDDGNRKLCDRLRSAGVKTELDKSGGGLSMSVSPANNLY